MPRVSSFLGFVSGDVFHPPVCWGGHWGPDPVIIGEGMVEFGTFEEQTEYTPSQNFKSSSFTTQLYAKHAWLCAQEL